MYKLDKQVWLGNKYEETDRRWQTDSRSSWTDRYHQTYVGQDYQGYR